MVWTFSDVKLINVKEERGRDQSSCSSSEEHEEEEEEEEEKYDSNLDLEADYPQGK